MMMAFFPDCYIHRAFRAFYNRDNSKKNVKKSTSRQLS